MLTSCPCEGSWHQPGCAFYEPSGDIFEPKPVPRRMQRGWACPACGTVNAPWKPTCDCPGTWKISLGNTTPTPDTEGEGET